MEPSDSTRTWPARTEPPTSLDPRLWPRPYVDRPADGPQGGPIMMPRFTPADAAAPPLAQRPPARPALPAAPAGAPPGSPAPYPGRGPVPPPPAAARGAARREPVRAVIGDEIRVPFIWCEFGTCDATYMHPDALGERDLRARALAAGWRYDALGRRACPNCAQHDPTFWTARPPAPVAGDWRRAG